MKRTKKTLATIGKNAILVTIDEIEKFIPPSFYTHSALFACKIALASFFDLYPDEGKEFLKQIKEKVNNLSDELFSSKEFQQSLALTLETLLRTREKRKRDLIKKIYLEGYIPIEDRYKVNLERFYSIAQELSIEGLEYLKFMNDVILPLKVALVKDEISKMNKQNRENDDEWWFKFNMYKKSESEVIMKWIYDEYNPNSKIVQSRVSNVLKDKNLRSTQFEEERKKENQYAEIASEYLSLGIFRSIATYDGNAHTLTQFGKGFIDFVRVISLEYV